jgi:hypothetical protein
MSISASTVRASQNGRARAPDTLQQQREIELCIGVVRRYPQGAQAFDGGLNASLPVQQVTKVYQASANVGSTRVAARKAASASTLRRSTFVSGTERC